MLSPSLRATFFVALDRSVRLDERVLDATVPRDYTTSAWQTSRSMWAAWVTSRCKRSTSSSMIVASSRPTVFKASLASSPADAAFIEVSGVLKSCARASSTVARNSLLSRAASTFAVAWSARGRWPASGAESIFAADGAGGERRGEARGGAAQYAGLSLYGGIGVEAEQREKLNGSRAT